MAAGVRMMLGRRHGGPRADASAPAPGALEPEAAALIEECASKIVRLRLAAPALVFLETGKPLAFLGSQALFFAEPLVRSLFVAPRYADLARLLEDRANVERLIERIEVLEEDRIASEKEARAARRAARRDET